MIRIRRFGVLIVFALAAVLGLTATAPPASAYYVDQPSWWGRINSNSHPFNKELVNNRSSISVTGMLICPNGAVATNVQQQTQARVNVWKYTSTGWKIVPGAGFSGPQALNAANSGGGGCTSWMGGFYAPQPISGPGWYQVTYEVWWGKAANFNGQWTTTGYMK